MSGGKQRHTRIKLDGTMTAANIPKALIGIKGLRAFDKNATHVVLEVRNMVLKALLRV